MKAEHPSSLLFCVCAQTGDLGFSRLADFPENFQPGTRIQRVSTGLSQQSTESEGKASDGWKSSTGPAEAGRAKACQANVRNKLSKQRMKVRELLERGWAVLGIGRPIEQDDIYSSMPMKVQLVNEMRAEGRV